MQFNSSSESIPEEEEELDEFPLLFFFPMALTTKERNLLEETLRFEFKTPLSKSLPSSTPAQEGLTFPKFQEMGFSVNGFLCIKGLLLMFLTCREHRSMAASPAEQFSRKKKIWVCRVYCSSQRWKR